MVQALQNGVKGGRWYSVIDKVLTLRSLEAAFARVKANKGGVGVDHMTIEASDILTPPIATACFPDDWTVRALSIRGNPFRLFGWVADGKYRGILPRKALRGPPWPSAIAGHASKLAQTSPPLPRAPLHEWQGDVAKIA